MSGTIAIAAFLCRNTCLSHSRGLLRMHCSTSGVLLSVLTSGMRRDVSCIECFVFLRVSLVLFCCVFFRFAAIVIPTARKMSLRVEITSQSKVPQQELHGRDAR